ncbi:MFS family permease [Arthrobacter stackebrandtii]|uniref:MFS family permease n=1 Tax=Arthrobacter stackebrandtii TaxID=272161 RepID=A0ABS4YTM0_9MICC|nr:MFS transporter [Arthrobacter stackebrandtii]MBP2412142.1 MFS family permease [Arthrobacter stackebrandtii]PYH01942.1 MFS transporter [Arthrobacter stackebrandtii]
MNSMFRALKVFNYRLWVTGALVSNIGTWMQRVAQDWLVLTVLTNNSGTAAGIVTGLQFLPIVFLGPYAGLLGDRVNKRRLLLLTQTAMGFCALVLGVLVVTGAVELWHVYVLAFLLGVASAFDAPSRQAFVSEVVEKEDVPNAVALNSASFNLARLAGPGVAGIVIALVGTGPAFLINAASFGAVILSLLRMRTSELVPAVHVPRAKGQIREGLVYIRQRPDLLMIMVLVFVVGTFGMNFQITNALMATTVFHLGPGEYGLLGSVMAVGTLAAALLAARRRTMRMLYVVGGALAFGVTVAVAAFMPTFGWYALALVPVGLASLTFMNACNTTVQLTTDAAMRGRVLAVYMVVLQGGTPIGAPLVGWIATEFGARWSLGMGAVAAMAAGMLALLLMNRRNNVRFRDQVRQLRPSFMVHGLHRAGPGA